MQKLKRAREMLHSEGHACSWKDSNFSKKLNKFNCHKPEALNQILTLMLCCTVCMAHKAAASQQHLAGGISEVSLPLVTSQSAVFFRSERCGTLHTKVDQEKARKDV